MKKFWISIIPGIAWFFILLYLMCLPGQELPNNDWLDKIHFDKIAHFCSFALLTFLLFYPFLKPGFPKINPRHALSWIVWLMISWGIITEIVQYLFVPNRSFDLWDWVFDSLGIFVARAFALRQMRNPGRIPT
ncbi:MAG: VanZ family protein [Chitinophagaceae bacterium]